MTNIVQISKDFFFNLLYKSSITLSPLLKSSLPTGRISCGLRALVPGVCRGTREYRWDSAAPPHLVKSDVLEWGLSSPGGRADRTLAHHWP